MRRGFDERGQMAVELAVVLPVVLIVLVIAIDCAVYLGECARFDHLAAQSECHLALAGFLRCVRACAGGAGRALGKLCQA